MTKCNDVHYMSNAAEKCSFVLNITDCQNDEGFFNYVEFVYCDLEGDSLYGVVILLAVWLTVLFLIMALTTESFFCPALDAVAKSLRLSENVAGVTLLALGNGAADIFGSVAAVNQDRPELIISGLFGGGLFDTCIVVGIIILGNNTFEVPQVAFLRDGVFYLMASFWAFAIYFKGAAHMLDAFGFLVMYLAYLAAVLLVPMIYRRWCKDKEFRNGYQPIDDNNTVSTSQHCNGVAHVENSGTINTELADVVNEYMLVDDDDVDHFYHMLENQENDPERAPLLAFGSGSVNTHRSLTLMQAISPIDYKNWVGMKWHSKIRAVLKAPVLLLLKITVPVIDKRMPNHNWCRVLNSLHLITGPMFVIFAVNHGCDKIGGVVPAWSVVLVFGFLLAVTVFCITSTDERPKYHMIFAYLGFAISNVWVYLMANEIINILKTIGILLNINDALLGITVLSWGNNISDVVADFTMAKRGYPAMGVAACFGGPLLNLLVGMGLAFGIPLIRSGNPISIPYMPSLTVLSGFLFANLVSSLFAMIIMKFKPKTTYGIYLLFLYTAFIICAILNTLGIFKLHLMDTR